MDEFNLRGQDAINNLVRNYGRTPEDAAVIVNGGNYKAYLNTVKGTGTGNINKAPGEIKNDYTDMTKANKAVEKEAKKIQNRSAFNASDKSQPNLVGTTASDPAIGKSLKQVAAQNRNETLDNLGLVGLKTTATPQAEPTSETETEPQPETETAPQPQPETETAPTATPAEQKDKQAYNKSMSIISAWRNGLFGDPDSDDAKERRNYFIMDALSKASKNLGNDFGRIAAAYGGGTYTGDTATSQWEDRNRQLNEAAVSAEEAGVEGSDKAVNRETIRLQQAAQKLANYNTQQRANLADRVQAEMANMDSKSAEYKRLASLVNTLRSGGATTSNLEDMLTTVGFNLLDKIGIHL